MSVFMVGNRPAGYFVHAYPPAVQASRDVYGAKVFFFRAMLLNEFRDGVDVRCIK